MIATTPPAPPAAFLLSRAGAESGLFDVMFAVMLVLLGVALLIGVVAAVRKRFAAADEADAAAGFSLGGLRQLVKAGKMTQDEYDRAKAQIVAAHQKAEALRVADQAASERAIPGAVARRDERRPSSGRDYVPPAP